jgi:hypothetical protein
MFYPSYAKDVILKWLQEMFGQEAFYQDQNLSVQQLEDLVNQGTADLYDLEIPTAEEAHLVNEFVWQPNQEDTKIFIADQYTENMERTEPRPALIVTRGAIGWENKGGIDQKEAVSFNSGAKRFTDLLFTQVTVNCFSREGLEAEKLANIVFQCVRFFAQQLRSRANVFEIDSASLGSEALIETDSKKNLSVVPVGLVFHFQDRWVLRIPGERAEKIKHTMDVEPTKRLHQKSVITLDD